MKWNNENEQLLRELYKNTLAKDIANILNTTLKSVEMKAYKLGLRKTLAKNSCKSIESNGYYCYQSKGKKILMHRVTVEKCIGRKLQSKEIVHHLDGNPANNRPRNLSITNTGKHLNLHKKINRTIKRYEGMLPSFMKGNYRNHIEKSIRLNLANEKGFKSIEEI